MPFNASGFFQRLFNWRNDRDAGVKILAERMDQEMDGIVAGINDIVSANVDWKGPIRGVLGTTSVPAFSFQDDPNTGIYRVSADILGFTVGGVKKAEFSATGLNVSGNVTATNLNVSGTTTLDWTNVNDGAGSGADADLLDGQHGPFYQNAGNLNAGTVPMARLSGTYIISITGNAATANTATNATQLGGQLPDYYANIAARLGYSPANRAGDAFSGTVDITGPTSDQLRLRTSAAAQYTIGRNATDGLLEFSGSQAGHTGYAFTGVDGVSMKVDPAGRVLTPKTPMFTATGTAVGVAITSGTILPFNISNNNMGNHYSTSHYRFTAPIEGRYLFYASYLNYPNNATDIATFSIIKNGGGFYEGGMSRNQPKAQETTVTMTILDLAQGDYVEARLQPEGTSYYYLSGGHGVFMGYLLG